MEGPSHPCYGGENCILWPGSTDVREIWVNGEGKEIFDKIRNGAYRTGKEG